MRVQIKMMCWKIHPVQIMSCEVLYILKSSAHINCESWHVVCDLLFILLVSNSGINPFVCTIRLKQFKRSVTALFCCCNGKAKVMVEESSSSSDLKDIERGGINVGSNDSCTKNSNPHQIDLELGKCVIYLLCEDKLEKFQSCGR